MPAGVTCPFNPDNLAASGSAVTTTATFTASASASAVRHGRSPFLPASALALAGCLLILRKRRPLALSLVPLAAFLALGCFTACGGGGNGGGGGGGPQPTTSTVTITATSGSLQQSATVSLTVN